jgi:SAM-dependent methyltransferase
MAMPGLGDLLAHEVKTVLGGSVRARGFDGRADVCVFDLPSSRVSELRSLSVAEDVFVEIGRTLRSEGDNPRWIANRIMKRGRVERAAAAVGRPLGRDGRGPTYRVIARVQSERAFRRTDLRRAMTTSVSKLFPNWRHADPAELEIWTIEYQPGRFVSGLRASDTRMRQRGGRKVERRGALRPTVARAMVALTGDCGRLLDPCCGSGTILVEALRAGCTAVGTDIDAEAVKAARRNAPHAEVRQADVRQLPFADAGFDAVVSNLPFGQQYGVDEPMKRWLAHACEEVARVIRPGGRAVLLAPELPASALPAALTVTAKTSIKLLGVSSTIWQLDRSGGSA